MTKSPKNKETNGEHLDNKKQIKNHDKVTRKTNILTTTTVDAHTELNEKIDDNEGAKLGVSDNASMIISDKKNDKQSKLKQSTKRKLTQDPLIKNEVDNLPDDDDDTESNIDNGDQEKSNLLRTQKEPKDISKIKRKRSVDAHKRRRQAAKTKLKSRKSSNENSELTTS